MWVGYASILTKFFLKVALIEKHAAFVYITELLNQTL